MGATAGDRGGVARRASGRRLGGCRRAPLATTYAHVYNTLYTSRLRLGPGGVTHAVHALLWHGTKADERSRRAMHVSTVLRTQTWVQNLGLCSRHEEAPRVDVPALRAHADRARRLARESAAGAIQRAYLRHLYAPSHAWHVRAANDALVALGGALGGALETTTCVA